MTAERHLRLVENEEQPPEANVPAAPVPAPAEASVPAPAEASVPAPAEASVPAVTPAEPVVASPVTGVQGGVGPEEYADRPPSIPPPDPLIGRTLDGRYRIESVLGEGGMGLVYRAKHVVLGKSLAIKVLRAEVSRDQEVMQRFQQEAQSASAIGSQHIIDISDFGTLPDGATYFVMEFLDGVSLTNAIEGDGRMQPARVVHIGRQLCDALGAAHERSIVHRDLKPDNIYLVKRGNENDFVKVLDFGIAKVGGASSKLTKAGQVFGTPHYMSPEQCAGTGLDHRTDVYAVGVILYEMACGRVPFDADNLMGILTKHMYEQPIPPHELPPPVEVPPGLEAVILRCLAKSPDARYQNMAELGEDLDRLLAGTTPEAVIHAVNRASNTQTGLRPDGTGRLSALQVGVGHVEVTPPPTSKVPLILGGLALLALVGGGGAFAAISLMDTSEPTPVVVAPPVEPPVITTPPDAVAVGTETAEGPSVVETPPTPVVVASVMILSDPVGAEVLLNGAVMGTTPLAVPRPSGSEIVNVTLRLTGYTDRDVAVTSVAAEEMSVNLTRRRGSSGGSSGGSSTSGHAASSGGGTASGGGTTTTTAAGGSGHSAGGTGSTGGSGHSGRTSGGADGVINPWGDD